MCVSPALKKFIIHLKELKNATLYTRISEMEKRQWAEGDGIWTAFKIKQYSWQKTENNAISRDKDYLNKVTRVEVNKAFLELMKESQNQQFWTEIFEISTFNILFQTKRMKLRKVKFQDHVASGQS